MISASRSYQNNLEVMNTAKSLLLKTIQLGSLSGTTPNFRRTTHGRQRTHLDQRDVSVTSTPRGRELPSTRRVTADRFLKLLVAQMQNQDPLNPMDNAQVTSQMAQINTVTGIDTAQHHGAGRCRRSSCSCRRCRAPRWSAAT